MKTLLSKIDELSKKIQFYCLASPSLKHKFILEDTYHSNCIEGIPLDYPLCIDIQSLKVYLT